MASVVNFNLLIWADREIPSQTIVAINTMMTIVVSGTTFRNSDAVKNNSLEKTDNNERD